MEGEHRKLYKQGQWQKNRVWSQVKQENTKRRNGLNQEIKHQRREVASEQSVRHPHEDEYYKLHKNPKNNKIRTSEQKHEEQKIKGKEKKGERGKS